MGVKMGKLITFDVISNNRTGYKIKKVDVPNPGIIGNAVWTLYEIEVDGVSINIKLVLGRNGKLQQIFVERSKR